MGVLIELTKWILLHINLNALLVSVFIDKVN